MAKAKSVPAQQFTADVTVERFVSQLKTHIAPGADPVKLVKDAGFSSPLVVVGADAYRLKRFLAWFRDQLFAGSAQCYFASELSSVNSLKPVAEDIRGLSLFFAHELLVIYDADTLKSAIASALAKIINQASASTFIILTVSKTEMRSSLLADLKQRPTTVSFQELSGETLKRWVEREARQQGAAGGVTPEAVELLVKSYGNDTSRISHELGKLALLAAPTDPLDRAMVEANCFQTPEHTSFELMQAIAKKDVCASQLLAVQLLEKGFHPLQLCHFLSRTFRTMLAHKSQEGAAGKGPEEICSELSNPWFVKNLRGLFPLFSVRELRRALELLKGFDFKLKDSKLSELTLLSTTVQRLCLRKA